MQHSIWGRSVPGNSEKSKLADMEINEKQTGKKASVLGVLSILRYWSGLSMYHDIRPVIDNLTYFSAIKSGLSKKTYEDEPCLTSYLVDESNAAVIVAPGGGYAFLGDFNDESSFETVGMARYLNERGYNAFVLNYRYNPYKFPIPLLDMQRAVRFVKYHAAEFGIDPSKVGIVGFSAGGYQVGGFLHLIQKSQVLLKTFPDYEPDEIDEVDDSVSTAGLLYPLTDFRYNKACLYPTMPFNPSKDRKAAKEAIEQYNLRKHLTDLKTPEFIAHGKKDMLISYRSSEAYNNALLHAEVPHNYYVIPDANHNFHPGTSPSSAEVFEHYIRFLDEYNK